MLWLKSSLLLGMIFSTSIFAKKFSSKQCLMENFNTTVEMEGKYFGLLQNVLILKKEACIITVNLKNTVAQQKGIKFFDTKWIVDICREPIHIKETSKGNQNVYKRKSKCSSGDKSLFCSSWIELNERLQDYGLIFAKGERESLKTSHGQTYCSYLLLSKYLSEGVLFSQHEVPVSLYSGKGSVEASSQQQSSEQSTAVNDDSNQTPPKDIGPQF